MQSCNRWLYITFESEVSSQKYLSLPGLHFQSFTGSSPSNATYLLEKRSKQKQVAKL